MKTDRRIPSLDGIRAIAIMLVLYWHVWYSTRGSFPSEGIDWGTLGVYIFFVLSGFLITSLLKRECEQTNFVSLKNFYIRRFFRIFPCLLCLLAAIKLLTVLDLSAASNRELLFSLSFLRNYYPGPYRILHHLWSLSVEEQFYLVWPFLFMRFSKRTLSALLVGIIAIVPIIRLIGVLRAGDAYTWHTEDVADALAWGCLLAIWQEDLRSRRVYQWFSRSYAAFALPFIIVAGANLTHQKENALIGKSATFLCVVLGIDILILRCNSPIGNILNSTPMVWLGKISYSLYLWQQIFLIVKEGDQPYAWFPANVILALLCATLSYHFIEKPAIRLGRSIASRRTRSLISTEAPVPAGHGV